MPIVFDDGKTATITPGGIPVRVIYNPSSEETAKAGGTVYIDTQDEAVITLLNGILKQMKIMNIHLSMMTDNEITKAELD